MKILALLIILSMPLGLMANEKDTYTSDLTTEESNTYKLPLVYLQQAVAFYDSLKLDSAGLGKEVFLKAYKGYLYLTNLGLVKNSSILSIADLSQSSRNKRLYIIDLQNTSLLFNTYVSHGKNSGGELATSFSNRKNSYKSSLGFLLTTDTYTGCAGYSLRFQGMERGINDNARNRAIIVHGSKYVNEETALRAGKVGNSLGCPAVPMSQSREIINAIKGGSVYFIYNPDENYNAASPILNASIAQPSLSQMLAVSSVDSTSTPQ